MPTSGGGGGSGGSGQGQAPFGPIALTPGVPLTIVRLRAASNRPVKVVAYGFYPDGTSNSGQPIEIKVGRISADGTFAAGVPTPNEEELSTSFATDIGIQPTVEPSYSGTLKTFTVHPQWGYEHLAWEGREIRIRGGGMLGFVATSQLNVNLRGCVAFEEGG